MTIRRFAHALFSALLVLTLAAAAVTTLAVINSRRLVESQRMRWESHRLADELRKSSDDLTRFARAYVVTEDPTFERYYHDVLEIREGMKARPAHYERLYWDLSAEQQRSAVATASAAVPLQRLMEQAGFSADELRAMADAKGLSDLLVHREEEAFRLLKTDRAAAIDMLYDEVYRDEKARIMAPIDRVFDMLETRNEAVLDDFNRRTASYYVAIQALTAGFFGLLVVGYPATRRRVLDPIAAMQLQTRTFAADIERLAATTKRIALGNLQQTFTVQAPPIHSDSPDEVGDLSRLHDAMRVQLQEAGDAIASITVELSAAEQRLRGAHRDLLAIVDIAPTGLVIWNPDRTIRIQNKEAGHLLGIPPVEPAARRDYFMAFTICDRAGRPIPVGETAPFRALAGTATTPDELDLERRDGFKASLLVGAAPLRDEQGRVTGSVASFQDITKLRELDHLKDEFVAIVSHELRTPLTAIRGSIQLVLADEAVTDAEHRELLEAGLKSSDRLMRLINDILDVSKIEAGKFELSIARVDVAALVRRAIDGVQAVADLAGVEIESRVEPGTGEVDGDLDRLTQALINLLSNAIKFAPKGTTVTLSARATADGVAIGVEDRGPGIAPDDLPRLFKKFEQLGKPGGRRPGGTGLGLAITEAIVELHGGAITVDSAVGRGTTMTCRLPRRRAAEG
jgi:signal transduction histidine kinase